MNDSPVIAALATMRASNWTILFARLFGVKRVCEDSGCTVTMYAWRGKYYLTDWKEINHENNRNRSC